MMAQILRQLLELFRAAYWKNANPIPATPFKMNAVYVASEFQVATDMGVTDIPCILIMPNGGGVETGPFADTLTRLYNVVIRVVARSTDPNKYRDSENSYNIYDFSDDIRLLLAKNKPLSIKSNEGQYALLDRDQPITELDVMFGNANGHFNALDISLTYKVMESWDGDRNNQQSLRSPQNPLVLPQPAF